MQDESFRKSPETVQAEKLASLKSCSMSELKQRWRALYHCEPPLRISRELLTRALAYRIQEQVYPRSQAIDPKTPDCVSPMRRDQEGC